MANVFVPAPVPPFPEATVDCDRCRECDFPTYDATLLKSIDFDVDLYGNVKPFEVHLCIATGKHDWRHTIEEEPQSGALAIHETLQANTGPLSAKERIVVTNTSLEPERETLVAGGADITVLSKAWVRVRNVTTDQMQAFVDRFVLDRPTTSIGLTRQLEVQSLPHRAVVLICSHNRRDARCGKTAPILHETFEEVLRERNLFYDPDEHESSDLVQVEYCSHVGGHKFAGNVLIYRRYEADDATRVESVWYGRVMPKHVPLIVDYTILHGEVLRPLLRGGMRW